MSNLGNKEAMSKNLKWYIEASGKERRELADIWGFPYSTVTEWINGKKYPRIDRIEIMADYFGILKSDLIEEKAEHMPLHYRGTLEGIIGRDAELLEMIQKYMKLDDKNKKAVKQMIENLSE